MKKSFMISSSVYLPPLPNFQYATLTNEDCLLLWFLLGLILLFCGAQLILHWTNLQTFIPPTERPRAWVLQHIPL